MNADIAALIGRIQALGDELEAEMAKRRAELSVRLEEGRAFFDESRTEQYSGGVSQTTGEHGAPELTVTFEPVQPCIALR